MDQEDFGPTQPTRTSKRSQDNGRDKGHKQLKQKERQATYGHRKPKGSVGKILVEKSLMEKGKSKPGSGERREKELKVAEPKDFDQVLRSFSDKSLEDLMSEGRFDDLRAVCSAVASFCPIPHMHLLQTLPLARGLAHHFVPKPFLDIPSSVIPTYRLKATKVQI